MKHLFYIALGGSGGAVLRYLTSKHIQSSFNIIFPVGTLFVNITGSFFIGFLFYIFDYTITSSDLRSFLTIGFLGAYTTFSTYSLETINLIKDGEFKLGLINLLLSNTLCLIMVFIGIISSKILLKIIK